ncbi:MAG: hypothetical protein H0X40_18155 [Chthoniobacterales bacterium]|nr:hypothetical protein [Chthoniobacterales bacterium]
MRTNVLLLAASLGRPVPARVWVLFCGNGSLALDWLPLARRDQNTGDAFLLIDYPGYGKISPAMGRELAREFPTFVSFHGLPDATHDTIVAAAADDMLEMLSH